MGQVIRRRRVSIVALFLVLTSLTIAALPVTASAQQLGSTNDTNYTYSTKTVYDPSYATASQRVDTFAVELIAKMLGGTTLYDQTFNVVFSDAAVQAAILTAQGVLTTHGAASFVGPTPLSNSTSLVGSVSQTGAPVSTGTDVSAATTAYIGDSPPMQTIIMVGADQSQQFYLSAGQIDYDTLITSLVHQLITTITTDTYLTTDVYELIGVPGTNAPVPEPATILLLGAGLVGIAGYGRRKLS